MNYILTLLRQISPIDKEGLDGQFRRSVLCTDTFMHESNRYFISRSGML
jgi:hypothetical protein